jgi:hypothetical protein
MILLQEVSMTQSVAESVRAVVAEAPAGSFIRSADVPGSRAAVNTAMSRMAGAGELVRVHHGLYWKGVQSRFGPGRPGVVDVAIAVVGPAGAGPSGWSAAQALGLSTQVPAEPEVAVAGPVPSFAGVRFHRRNNLARRDLGFWEIALLEALRSYPAYAEVSMAELAGRVRTLAAEGKVRFARLETAARREHSPALRRNLAAVREWLPEAMLS